MIFISIMILIVAIALKSLSPVLLTRISAIVFIYAGVLSLNALDIQSIGSGIGIYSGLFHVTTVSQLIDTFIFIIGSLILISWPTCFNVVNLEEAGAIILGLAVGNRTTHELINKPFNPNESVSSIITSQWEFAAASPHSRPFPLSPSFSNGGGGREEAEGVMGGNINSNSNNLGDIINLSSTTPSLSPFRQAGYVVAATGNNLNTTPSFSPQDASHNLTNEVIDPNKINSSILRAIIDEAYKEFEGVKNDLNTQFSPLTPQDASRMLRELEEFKNAWGSQHPFPVGLLKLEGAGVADEKFKFYENLNSQLNLFRDKYRVDDERFKALFFRDKVSNNQNLLNSFSKEDNIGLKDFTVINQFIRDNKNEILKNKPLGNFGEVTLFVAGNEIIDKSLNVLGPLANNININSDVAYGTKTGFVAGSLYLLYKSSVKLYIKSAFPLESEVSKFNPQQLMDYKKMRSKEVAIFMIFEAPVILYRKAGTLYMAQKLALSPKLSVNVNVSTDSSAPQGGVSLFFGSIPQDPTPATPLNSAPAPSPIPSPCGIGDGKRAEGGGSTEGRGSIISSGLMYFFTNTKKIPSWLKKTLLIFICTVCVSYILKYYVFIGNSDDSFNIISKILSYPLVVKLIKIYFVFSSIASFLLICYYTLCLCLYVMFSKGKISMPIHLPEFILDWLRFIQKISQHENKGVFIDVYFRNIIIYIIVFISAIFVLYILFPSFAP